MLDTSIDKLQNSLITYNSSIERAINPDTTRSGRDSTKLSGSRVDSPRGGTRNKTPRRSKESKASNRANFTPVSGIDVALSMKDERERRAAEEARVLAQYQKD